MNNIIFHQLFEKETSTYTYLIADAQTKEGILIDSVIETVERDLNLIQELGITLKYVLDTHVHADHITGSGEIRKRTGAKLVLGEAYGLLCTDLNIKDGEELAFGNLKVKALHTPGHTSGCVTYKVGKMLFTGDALLIRGCGRTDFQEGSAETLYESIHQKVFAESDDTIIYPGHDYKGFTHSSVGVEKNHNRRLNLDVSKEEFVEIMDNLNLADPKKIKESVPANLLCGDKA